MGFNFFPEAYSAGITTGVTTTTTASSQRVAIPVDATGAIPRVIIVVATANMHIKLGDGTVTATANDLMVPSGTFLPLLTRGCSSYAVIQETASAKVTVSPCEF